MTTKKDATRVGRRQRTRTTDDKTEQAETRERTSGKTEGRKPEKPKPTVIDLAGIGNRILSLPIPPRNYIDLSVGKTGVLYLAEGDPVGRASGERRAADPIAVGFYHREAPDRGDAQRADRVRGLFQR